jgi:hypothetical protein
MRRFSVVLCFVATTLGAQQPDTVRKDSTRADSSPPTPAQERYLDGLRTVGRGIAQLKDGIDRVARAYASKDSVKLVQAGRRLGGLCGTAHAFMAPGRTQMSAVAYDDSVRTHAKKLGLQIDSVITYMPACQHTALRTPTKAAADVLGLIRSYETALKVFRTDIGLNRPVPAPTQ